MLKISQIRSLTDCVLHGTREIEVNNVSSLFNVEQSSITWVNPSTLIDWDKLSFPRNVIVIANKLPPSNFYKDLDLNYVAFALCDDPKKTFSNCLQELIETKVLYQGKWYDCERNEGINIHPSAIVNCDINAKKIRNISIGPNVFLSEFVTVSDNLKVGPGTIIGGDGFGFFTDQNLQSVRMPHISGVILEDNVEIGANTTIDRGTLAPTVIGRNCKIDNLVHIAHNVTLGENTKIVSNTTICGSVKTGRNVWVGGNSIIRDALTIGDNSLVGIGSAVTRNIPANEIWAGNPAKKLRDIK